MDDDERAEAEMTALTLYHLRLREQKDKFVNRVPSMLFKALLIVMTVVLLPSLPAQFPVLINYFRRALATRTWDVINLILVGLAVFYGVISRGRPGLVEPDKESDGNESYVAKLFEFGGSFADYVDPGLGNENDRTTEGEEANVGGVGSSDADGGEERNSEDGWSPRRTMLPTRSPLLLPVRSLRNSVSYPDLTEVVGGGTSDCRRASDDIDLGGRSHARRSDRRTSEWNALDAAHGRPYPSAEVDIGKSEVNFGEPLVVEKNLSVDKAMRRHSAPPPAPVLSVESRPTQKDLNPGPRPEGPEKKPPSPPPPPPPRPPPRPFLAVETRLPPQVYSSRNAAQVSPRTENSEKKVKPEKIGKSGKLEKSEEKMPIPFPPPLPPTAVETGLPPKRESRHGRNKSKEDSKHRSKDESRHKNSGKEIAMALGLFSQSEKKQGKIPSPPAPPPPLPLPSTLQQWFSSYKRDSKHRSKDSEPSPRSRSEKSSRKVHSFSSPPPPPPLPPPPRPPPLYTTDGVFASNYSLKPSRDGASASKHSSKPRRDESSGNKDSSKTTRDGNSGSKDSSKARDGTSASKDASKAGRHGTSESKDSLKLRKEDMVGSVPDAKAGEKLARRRSSSIPLPPPPPPPFAMMVEEHWPPYDHSEQQKRSSSPVVLGVESAGSEAKREHEHSPELVIRRQLPLDSTEPQFCPSPSPEEVNRKADAFIARFHEQIRLQKMNSIRERRDRGSKQRCE